MRDKNALEMMSNWKSVYDAAMALYEMAESGRVAIDSDVSDGEAARVCVEVILEDFDVACRRAKMDRFRQLEVEVGRRAKGEGR